MQLSIDITGLLVFVIGHPSPARRTMARYLNSGANAVLLTAGQARVRLAAAGFDAHTNDPAALPLPKLIVWVEGRESQRTDLAAEAARLSIWLTVENAAPDLPRGHVTLVGAGPGDVDLITVAGRQALASADVVLYDRLAPTALLSEWAPGAELIDVGKTPGHHAVPQREIERIMIERALRGNTVVRLKGGDPFVFGRGGEEILACRYHRVPFTVIPGITSAISVPAAAGIPVTHRNLSRAFTVVSGHAPFSDDELRHLSGLGGTIVVLMGVGTLVHLVSGLMRCGMNPTMPLAIIERGYSADQRTTFSTVGTITGRLGQLSLRSPAVIVIGEVVRVSSDEADGGLAAEGIDLAAIEFAT
ncbi:MAG: hypothetical protein JWQ19_2601 [Subtercola sp.]|nr:hypothetical protein [Subtercola sp.]